MDPTLKAKLQRREPLTWINPGLKPAQSAMADLPIRSEQVDAAVQTWNDLAPLLRHCFDSLSESNGRIQSQLIAVPELNAPLGIAQGNLFIKGDHALPVAGSVKARGGVYEVFLHGLNLARQIGLINADDRPEAIASPEIRKVFERYTVAVGSTGNLGLSVGIAARALGFRAVVHMSSDAKAWKVERLRNHGVEVVQHQADYGTAVACARNDAQADETVYFVDDERSELLFFGYAAAALELRDQLNDQGIVVDADHPLFLYLPCGIGGAPGGLTFGAKHIFGDHVHCFFVEPADAPCALVQLASGLDYPVSVYDIGLSNKTEADGMAVAEVSQFVAGIVAPLLSGVYTVADEDLFRWLALAQDLSGLQLEPSAAACMGGPTAILHSVEAREWTESQNLNDTLTQASHVMWATGGSLVPADEYAAFLIRGRASLL